jgi:hypothetical protein
MEGPKTREQLEQEKIRINDEAQKYIDTTGDTVGGLSWRDLAIEEVDYEIKNIK